MAMTIDNLEAFVKAAEYGSFSATARALKKTQPAVSTAIANLEIDLGVELFDRSAHKPVLTQQGSELLTDARNIVSQLQVFQSKAQSLEVGVEASITLAVAEFVPQAPLIGFLKEFEHQFPFTTLNLLSVSLREVIRLIAAGEADIAVIPEDPTDIRSVYHATYLFDLPTILVTSPEHPLAELEDKLEAGQLSSYRQISVGDPDQSVDAIGVVQQSSSIWRINNTETLLAAVKEGLGWAYLPQHLVVDDLEQGTLVKLPLQAFEKDYTFKIEALWREDEKRGPVARWACQRLARLWCGN
ncbi:LysR family transcriptional regulator [Pseudomaricurvus alkylphenolicus]|jgi:DNA-binding transcriptional LysR family regulator|uniref:LysR family transcriptional regulator n=1 Tax=Pseudomaricurvus alkylphenolicus TaxID=1306991 RepID=UPI001423F98E|nr:LysR family transcriptional regulator [Pseudomaricurvus alkylphenolicus]NIB38556.1 LysR family transcriptional regulator [Pseudomaricurvus alkylphenolicus]